MKELVDRIYNYCQLAMNYDLDGLIFNPVSLASAIANKKEELKDVSEEDFNTLKITLAEKVQELYERNKIVVDKVIDEKDIIKNMTRDEAKDEMYQAEKFLAYINEKLDYVYFKKIIG